MVPIFVDVTVIAVAGEPLPQSQVRRLNMSLCGCMIPHIGQSSGTQLSMPGYTVDIAETREAIEAGMRSFMKAVLEGAL
jgi:hypothetical protein